MPALKELMKSLWKTKLDKTEEAELLPLSFDLLASEYQELRAFGILILEKMSMAVKRKKDQEGQTRLLDHVELIFDGGSVTEWGTCDSLCSKV